MKKTKIIAIVTFLALGMTSSLSADEFTALSKAGAGSMEAVQGAIKAFIWIAALAPLGLSAFITSKVKEHQERQEEQGQHQPKVAKYASLVGAFIGGVVISYVLYGVAGAVFFDKTFSEMWAALVTTFFSAIIS